MFEPLEVKILRTAGWLWLKLVATLALGTLVGCSIADAKMHDEPPPDIAAADVILPVPQDERLPPPVERPTESDRQPTVDTAPGGDVSPIDLRPLVLVYGPPKCAPCQRAINQLLASRRYYACKEEKIPIAIHNLVLNSVDERGRPMGYPFVVFTDAKGEQRYVWPWRGLADFEIHYQRTMNEPMKGQRPGSHDAKKPPAAPYAMFDPDSRTDVWDGFFGLRRERLARKGKL